MKTGRQPNLGEEFIFRAATMADVEEIVDLLNDYWERSFGIRVYTIDEIGNGLTLPGFDMETATRVIHAPDGRMVGYAIVWDMDSPPVHPDVAGCVDSCFEGQGIGTYLLKWAEERARLAINRVPDGTRVATRLYAPVGHEPTEHLLQALGMDAIRYALFMVTDLDGAPPEPQWPDGITVRTYQDYPEERAIYRAMNEAFRDHWGYVEGEEEEQVEQWRHRIENDEGLDPSLWFLAMDGCDVAGMALCAPILGDDPEMGFVETLAVRRPWRRRGVALALLHHSFGEFHRRGHKQVSLGVDAGSLTGATGLYEKAGMRAERQIATYEMELRPGKELGTHSIES